MTYLEPERLVLQLQELLERRATLRAVLENAMADALTPREQGDIRRVLASIDGEMAALKERLASLRSGPAGGAGS